MAALRVATKVEVAGVSSMWSAAFRPRATPRASVTRRGAHLSTSAAPWSSLPASSSSSSPHSRHARGARRGFAGPPQRWLPAPAQHRRSLSTPAATAVGGVESPPGTLDPSSFEVRAKTHVSPPPLSQLTPPQEKKK